MWRFLIKLIWIFNKSSPAVRRITESGAFETGKFALGITMKPKPNKIKSSFGKFVRGSRNTSLEKFLQAQQLVAVMTAFES